MNDADVGTLVSSIEKQLSFADLLYGAVDRAMGEDVPKIGKTANAAVMVAGLIENYYTCLETAYLKISQHFENHLERSHWHADLLDKMTLHIEGVRIAAVADETYSLLKELQRFRHFKRYYFDLEYDWERMDFLLGKLRKAHPLVKRDLNEFLGFLRRVDS